MATTYKAFLEVCRTWDEFNALLDIALADCFAADLHMASTGQVWLAFHDGSDCYVNTPKE